MKKDFKEFDLISISPTFTGLGSWIHGLIDEINGDYITMKADEIQEDGKKYFYAESRWFLSREEGATLNQKAIAERIQMRLKQKKNNIINNINENLQ